VDDGWLFFNYGYEEDPPMTLPLAPSDEPHRFFPTRAPDCEPGALSGKRVLEATAEQRRILQERCTRPPTPDLNPAGIEFGPESKI